MFFSGQIEFPLINEGHTLVAYTNKPVIFEFWRSVVSDAHRVAAHAVGMHMPGAHPETVSLYQSQWPTYRDSFMRSGVFFLLNRYSQTGTVSHGSFKIDNFSPFAIEALKNFSSDAHKFNLKLYESEDVEEGFVSLNADDILLIPAGTFSYNLLTQDILEGYETYNIHHRRLKEALLNTNQRFVLCYKKHPGLLRLYDDQQIILVSKFGKPTAHFDLAEDMIIHNLPPNE
tara:strand:- start:467 stop:1156 length:690 start_codon:yes stop_codon:yes gene_type:complete